jgi:putative oxidoreductase
MLGKAVTAQWRVNVGLLFLRVAASTLVMVVHGLPKVVHYTQQAATIEDPFHLGKTVSILFAILAEFVCPPLIMLGVCTRLACLPILAVVAIALVVVHREWTLAEGQFAWMLLILFGTIAITGPGELAPRFKVSSNSTHVQ